MSTYPKIAYLVASNAAVTNIYQRKLLRETKDYYFFEDHYIKDREDKQFKSRVDVFFTFAEAQAFLIARKQTQIRMAEHKLMTAQADLATAETLTGPTHVDNPQPMPNGPLTI